MKTTEKKIKVTLLIALIIFFTFLSLQCSGQNGISFSILQDVKLGLGLDADHGNDKPTADLIFNMNWQGKQFEYYYFAIQTQYENANLSSGYLRRYSVHGIWNFNKLLIEKLSIGTGIGIGMIHRENYGGFPNYSGTIDINYPIAKNLSLIAKNEWVKRTDLKNKKIGYNLSFGITYKPINL